MRGPGAGGCDDDADDVITGVGRVQRWAAFHASTRIRRSGSR